MLLIQILIFIAIIIASSVFGVKVSAKTEAETDVETIKQLLEMDLEDLMKVEIVTIATGAKQTVTKAPATTTVITAEDIEMMGAIDLNEVLETVPGLHIARTVNMYRPIYTIRGIYSEVNPEVLVLINGIPITSMYAERGFAWGDMPIHAISRIEVIRGPGSAVYGADAFAGVINLITKTKEDLNGTEIGTRVGSFDTYDGWILHGGNWNGFDIATSLEYHTTEGQDRTVEVDAQTQYDKLFGTHISLAPGPVNTGTENIDARIDVKRGLWQARAGYQGRPHLGLGVGVGHALDPVGYVDGERTNVDLTYHNPTFTSPWWDVTTQLSYFDMTSEAHYMIFPPGAFGGTYPDGYISEPKVSERHLRLDTFAFYAGFQSHLIRIGTGYHHHDQYKIAETKNYGIDPTTGQPLPPGHSVISVTDTPYIFNREGPRNNWFLSLQDVWTIATGWELTAGLRYDNYSDFGNTVNPRLALVWQTTPDLTTKLMYGRAFRAPSYAELYNANNPSSQGNPNLDPETINTRELAFDYRVTSNLHLATNWFNYDIEDKIITSPDPGGKTNTFKNIGHWIGSGFEQEVRWKMTANFSLQANYSYARVINQKNSSDIGNYPRHSASIRMDWLVIPNGFLDVQTNWIAERQRVFGDPRPEIADYTTVDLTWRYKNILERRAQVALGVRNLFDADAREPSQGLNSKGFINVPNDLPLARRSVFVELRYKF